MGHIQTDTSDIGNASDSLWNVFRRSGSFSSWIPAGMDGHPEFIRLFFRGCATSQSQKLLYKDFVKVYDVRNNKR